jgi:hypothetical protein
VRGAGWLYLRGVGGEGWLYLRGVGVGEGGAQGIRISRQVLGLGSSVAGHGQNQLQGHNKADE